MSSKWRRWIAANLWPVFSIIPFKRDFSFTWLILYSLLSRRHQVRFSSDAPGLQQELSLAVSLTSQERVLQHFVLQLLFFWALPSFLITPTVATDSLNISQTHFCLVGLAITDHSPAPPLSHPDKSRNLHLLPQGCLQKEYIHCTKVGFRLNQSWW